MYEMDYDAAASHWIEIDKTSAHVDDTVLKERIVAFVEAHDTCALATASEGMVRNTPIE